MRLPILRIAAIAAGLCLASASASAHGTTVTIGHNRVEPAEVTVESGGVVHFHNEDQMPGGHTVVADDGSFESPPLGKDEDFHHTFEETGRIGFHIKEHPDAKGTVVVE